jgi:hypothetical protein
VKLKYTAPLSNFAFNFNLRRYTTATESPQNIAAVSLAELGAVTLRAVACPTDPTALDPSDLFTATLPVQSPTAAGGADAPAEAGPVGCSPPRHRASTRIANLRGWS